MQECILHFEQHNSLFFFFGAGTTLVKLFVLLMEDVLSKVDSRTCILK